MTQDFLEWRFRDKPGKDLVFAGDYELIATAEDESSLIPINFTCGQGEWMK